MVVEVGPEIQQLVFKICRGPEQHVIQICKSSGVCVLDCCALRGSDRFTATISIRQGQVREVQLWALRFSRNRARGYTVEILAGGLKTETARYKLPVDPGGQNGNPGLFVRAAMPSSSCPAPSRGRCISSPLPEVRYPRPLLQSVRGGSNACTCDRSSKGRLSRRAAPAGRREL